VWISEQTAIISLYNINWLVCITETECVYCAVRTVTFILDTEIVLKEAIRQLCGLWLLLLLLLLLPVTSFPPEDEHSNKLMTAISS